ncbi:WAP four-disulfide core domain protein 2 [Artibeus jamaicensis]|uniref:WAP four-disulfide core domain protein 2 n=1 Tax=Artibeus jamaicensis TaxID=9417 RepID=UPI00235B2B9E|nr:WAP four-disulfide core domain protein 2 [Artibeus jamaicensis]XP_037020493.2 WAP four-disulfide core domain protein 2 [Artibeus jamaicensis]
MTAGRLGPLVAPLFLGLVLLGFPLGTSAWIRERPDDWRTGPTTSGAEAVKTGVCPKLGKDPNCTLECSSDGECAGNLKCCQAGCAWVCHLPDEKPGSCPKVDLPLTPLGLCRDQCQVDSQCPDRMKCCRNGCGKVSCVTPVF